MTGQASLLSNDSFASNEIDIFHALLRWCNYTSPTMKEDRKSRLPTLLRHIRFSQMKLKELMKIVKPMNLLPEDTIYALVEAIADPSLASPELKEFNLNRRDPPATYRAATDQFNDNTGIIYWLGTREGKTTYTNPAEAGTGEVKVSMSSTYVICIPLLLLLLAYYSSANKSTRSSTMLYVVIVLVQQHIAYSTEV
jgi:hypothetical protein